MIQLQVLNKILQTGDASLITLNNLDAGYFSEYPKEFNFIKSHLDQYGNVPDLSTFVNNFQKFEVITVNESDSYLLKELATDKTRRNITGTYNSLYSLLLAGDSESIDKAMNMIRNAADSSASMLALNAVDLFHDTSRYDSYVDMSTNIDKYYIKTGFPELDSLIGGWNAKEDLVTIVARNGLGKSWILFKCAAEAAKQGKRVGLYSGEMGLDSVGYRIDTLIGGVSNGALMRGNASIRNEYKRFLDKMKEYSGNLFVITPELLGRQASPSIIRTFMEKYNLDIVFIDQYSLLDDDKNEKNPIQKLANISNDLKLIQATKVRPIVVVSQQNREKLEEVNGKKEFDTTQVAGSDRIPQNSSIVIFLEREDDKLKLHLTKVRNSESRKVLTYQVDLNTGKFKYIPDEEGGAVNTPSTSNYSTDEVF